MTVYVDPARHPFGRMVMCHLWADSLDELHAFADRLGLKREWFQAPPKASWHHYDVSKGVRDRAIGMGAVETDRFGPTEFLARRDGDERMLALVAKARALRTAAEGRLL